MNFIKNSIKSYLPKQINIVRSFSTLDKKYNTKFDTKFDAKSDGQTLYKKSLFDKKIDLIVCNGPAGSGKTSLACDYAINMLKNNKCKKIILTRPTVAIEENLGFLPGGINDKMYPWTIPIFDIFLEYFTKKDLDLYVKENIIEICPLGFIQGRTFKDAIIIADEMQNSSSGQMFMLLTRIGTNSKMIVNGDLTQTSMRNNGLEDLIDKIYKKWSNNKDELQKNNLSLIELQHDDIQRHEMVKKVITLYNKN